MTTNIVIIGGGPIGCWTAIQAKRHNPQANIHIYEKYPDYQRNHMLSIRRESLQTKYFAKFYKTPDEIEKAIFARIRAEDNDIHTQNKGADLAEKTDILVQDLEKILKEQCLAMGIGFTFAKIESPEDAMTRHPECHLFVAADGAHSLMRESLLGPDSREEKDLLHSVDVKYEAAGQAYYTREPTYDKIDMIVVENVGAERNGTSPVALRFLVNKAVYDSIPDATFKAPLKLSGSYAINAPGTPEGKKIINQPNIIGAFENDIRKFMAIRKEHTGEQRVQGSEQVTKITLSQYASKKFAVMKEDTPERRAGWFIVGDAAIGMPFYRSINAGLKLGSQLGPILADPATSTEIKTKLYEARRAPTVRQEFSAVSRRLAGINAYRNYARPALQSVRKGAIWGGISVGALIAIPIALPLIAGALIVEKIRPGTLPRLM